MDINGSVKVKLSLDSVLFVANVLSTFRKSAKRSKTDKQELMERQILQIWLVEDDLISFTYK